MTRIAPESRLPTSDVSAWERGEAELSSVEVGQTVPKRHEQERDLKVESDSLSVTVPYSPSRAVVTATCWYSTGTGTAPYLGEVVGGGARVLPDQSKLVGEKSVVPQPNQRLEQAGEEFGQAYVVRNP